MKSFLGLSIITILLTGCITVHTGKPAATKEIKLKGANIVENTKTTNRIVTRGQLICEAGQSCPELSIDWQPTRGEYALSLHLYDQKQLEMNEFTFIVDGKIYSYSVIGQTDYRQLEKSNIVDSSNTVMVPDRLLKNFKNAKNIAVVMSTNQGDITHYMYKNNVKSDAYRLFLRAYT
ncbi:hypothetical protein B9T33_12155 [Acinetobacter sp. ANC 5054]|uniref:hypothetical protein n=1 Tax=Acinetobacter sp. ANC 5054 TaxID=1977877 RepID=UPI000A33A149|nr:hypothetical protein [Acinetobacter sp. ANC 5054]OTG79532.1 hypothetical protein B9T33_12155 [Acinetobacter sp. ANC 5054]